MRYRTLWIALALLLALVLGTRSTGAASAAPAYTTTRYVTNPDPAGLYRQGCSAGKTANAQGPSLGAVILDFGQPWQSGGLYGTLDFGNHFDSLNTITQAARAWLEGWWDCTPAGGPQVRLGIGTSNYHGATGYSHGRAWAQMINDLGDWIAARGYGGQLSARGASDMELDWNTAAATRAWVDGYESAGRYVLYDYGDARGGVNPPPGWTVEDIWYKAYGGKLNYPLPEIYYAHMATRDWQPLSRWSYQVKGYPIYFVGTLTQYAADSATYTPAAGWQALYNALASDSRTWQGELDYSTDMTWSSN